MYPINKDNNKGINIKTGIKIKSVKDKNRYLISNKTIKVLTENIKMQHK